MLEQALNGIQLLKGAQEIVNRFSKSETDYDKALLKLEMAKVIDMLQQAKIEMYAKDDEIRERDLAIRDLKETLNKKASMKYVAPFYYVEQPDKRDGPFCAQCWDAKQLQIRLVCNDNDYWSCRTCTTGYEGPNYQVAQLFSGGGAFSGGSMDW